MSGAFCPFLQGERCMESNCMLYDGPTEECGFWLLLPEARYEEHCEIRDALRDAEEKRLIELRKSAGLK